MAKGSNLIDPGFRPGRMRILAAVACLLALCGCSTSPKACTLIGTAVGIGLDVDLPAVAAAELEVCWDGRCVTPPVVLRPATTNGPQTCTGTGPDDSCGVSAEFTGGLIGFADLPDLPAKPVAVTVTLTDAAGAVLLDQNITATPEPAYPNGPDCGAGGPQTRLLVSAAGVVTERV